MSKKSNRKQFGLVGGPIPCTRLLAQPNMPNFEANGIKANAIMAINDITGVATSVNVYDGHFGANYSTDGMTQQVPAAGDAKWKAWAGKGYEFLPLDSFGELFVLAVESEQVVVGVALQEDEVA